MKASAGAKSAAPHTSDLTRAAAADSFSYYLRSTSHDLPRQQPGKEHSSVPDTSSHKTQRTWHVRQ